MAQVVGEDMRLPEATAGLPESFSHTIPPPKITYQGAEAILYRTTFPLNAGSELPTYDAALKFRPRKTYRHPLLDAKLTRHRILSEARVLARLSREGVSVPAVYALDWDAGWMITEWIAGGTVRAVLDADLQRWLDAGVGGEILMRSIGELVGRMHSSGVVHGDLTTSNLMLRADDHEQVVLIDFGLSAQSVQDEDRAVDLYVLERAFGSTHPRTEGLFQEVLKAYGASYKGAKPVLKKFEEVRLRGRKKIMIG